MIMHLRRNDDWAPQAYGLQIRKNGKPIWTKHLTEDVEVMYVLPDRLDVDALVTIDSLTTDAVDRTPSDFAGGNRKCLGFPLGIRDQSGGFPILRTGDVASYPTPNNENQKFPDGLSSLQRKQRWPCVLRTTAN